MSTAKNWRFGVSGNTHIGGKSTNEDTFFTHQDPSHVFLGVFDGHGLHGLRVAEIARDTVVAAGPHADPVVTFAAAEAAARDTIIAGEKQMRRTAEVLADGTILSDPLYGPRQLARGGTTASTVHITAEGEVTHSHVGDSEAIIIYERTRAFHVLTRDHSTMSLDEFKRVQAEASVKPRVTFARLNPYSWGQPERHVYLTGADGEVKINPTGGFYCKNVRREWAAYLSCASPAGDESLNMMRSIGDFSLKKAGVCCRPDTVRHTLDPDAGRAIIITASDGLYDNFTYEELRDCALTAASVEGVTAESIRYAVLGEGLKRGYANFGRNGQDNTTVVVALCEPPAPRMVEMRFNLGYGYLTRRFTPEQMLRLMVATRACGAGFSYRVGERVVRARHISSYSDVLKVLAAA